MNSQAFATAKAAYQRGDWAATVSALNSAKGPGELNGEADHLKGNALMKLGLFAEAAEAYADALADGRYAQTHTGALNCNRGRALVAAGMPDVAVGCFQAAVVDPSYPTPYKAYLALGNVYERQGKAREAGMAWRSAAIDEANPDPASALVKLGACFLELNRPVDAVEAYRTALDFATAGGQGAVYAGLGRAYLASNRAPEALDAFARAEQDGTYTLTADERASYDAARRACGAQASESAETKRIEGRPSHADVLPDDTGADHEDASLAPRQDAPVLAPSQTGEYDPLDPMGRSGEFIPSAEDTGFFSVTEEDLMRADKDKRRAKRKHSHKVRNFFIFLLLLVLICGGIGGFAYVNGYGWPTQESVVGDLFSAASEGDDISGYLASDVDDGEKTQIVAILPVGGTAKVTGVDRATSSSTVLVTATLSSGGTQNYKVTLERDGIGWKVGGVELAFASQNGAAASSSTGTLPTTAAASTSAATVA